MMCINSHNLTYVHINTENLKIASPHINKLKDRNHVIISISTRRAFEKVQHPFLIYKNNKTKKKTSKEARNRRNVILNGEK